METLVDGVPVSVQTESKWPCDGVECQDTDTSEAISDFDGTSADHELFIAVAREWGHWYTSPIHEYPPPVFEAPPDPDHYDLLWGRSTDTTEAQSFQWTLQTHQPVYGQVTHSPGIESPGAMDSSSVPDVRSYAWEHSQPTDNDTSASGSLSNMPYFTAPSGEHLANDTSTNPPNPPRANPPPSDYKRPDVPHRQTPRRAGDEYTATWVRGEGAEREGWCGICQTWHRLKDSSYWYHMHYSHGISCQTGKPFAQPVQRRPLRGGSGYEVLCGGCNQWLQASRAERWKTTYFRHAYRCQARAKGNKTETGSGSISPRRALAGKR